MEKNLVILGAGGLAREASLLAEEINSGAGAGEKWNLLGFIDEDRSKWSLTLRGYPVLGGFKALEELPAGTEVVCAVGDPGSKKKMVEIAEKQGRVFANLIHPGVLPAHGDVKIGRGVLINKGTLLTTNISIADHVSVNPGCGIGHDVSIGAYATLMWRVNLSGAVEIEAGCLLGTGVTVLQNIRVGSWSVVGAGAVVTKELPLQCTAVGVPARVVKGRQKG